MDTAARNFAQSQAYLSKARESMSERDWRIFREDHEIYIKGGQCPNPIRNWDEAEGIPDAIRDNLEINQFTEPTPIQMQALPIGMAMRDMIGLAPTGSGKSAAFILPLVSFLLRQPPIRDNLV
mmetsp:Transcript_31265/g.38654  ORF Transcript_31265/g.38654 Transcript_31265/m.38654 type:complete len:123 (+) Transcript_31265:713-1081(+)